MVSLFLVESKKYLGHLHAVTVGNKAEAEFCSSFTLCFVFASCFVVFRPIFFIFQEALSIDQMNRYASPINPAVFPHLTIVLLSIGIFFMAWFFVYPLIYTLHVSGAVNNIEISACTYDRSVQFGNLHVSHGLELKYFVK